MVEYVSVWSMVWKILQSIHWETTINNLSSAYFLHISISLIEKAREEVIAVLKLPPHVMNKILSLEFSCFWQLKRACTELLNERMNLLGPKEGLTTVHLLICFSQVWYKGLSEINIISRFKATGIFPTNRDKYNIKWFDQQLYTATSIGFS